jgi:hypothetical protein
METLGALADSRLLREGQLALSQRSTQLLYRARPHAVQLQQFRLGDSRELLQARVARASQGPPCGRGQPGGKSEASWWRGIWRYAGRALR